tara:strand:- start:3805 stop:5079 length:1275 start_codon:yes stop_codon:yes gene_type:complete
MAETGGTTPSYGLSASTQAAVREAGVGGEARERGLKTKRLDAVSKGVKTAATGVALGLEARRLREEEKKKKEKALANAENKFNQGLSKISQMGWADEQMYQQFIEIEKAEKKKYLAAIQDGDKELAAELLRQQQQRAAELEAMKGTMATAAEVNGGKGGGWSNKIKKSDLMQHVLGSVAALDENASWEYETDEYGVQRMMVTVTAPADLSDEDAEEQGYEKGADGKWSIKYSKSDIDNMVAEGIAPSQVKQKYREELSKYKQTGAEGDTTYDWDTIRQNNIDNLTQKDITTFIHEPVFGENRTFVDDFISDENPVWKANIKVTNPKLAALEEQYGDGDGIIEEGEWDLIVKIPEDAEFESLDAQADAGVAIQETRRMIALEMENQPEIARKYIGDFVTKMQEQNVKAGQNLAKGSKKNEKGSFN